MNRLVERNYLEINSLNELIETIPPSKNIKLELLNPPDFNLSKFFYKQIGKKYHWVDRLDWSDNAWIKYTENENVKTYILKEAEEMVGYFEQVHHDKKQESEIAYLGILEEYFGKNYGSYLLSEAIKISFKNNNNLEIEIAEKFVGERGRINCSLRENGGFWRWLGIQFVISDK